MEKNHVLNHSLTHPALMPWETEVQNIGSYHNNNNNNNTMQMVRRTGTY